MSNIDAIEWVNKEGYPEVMTMTKDNLIIILNRYAAQFQSEHNGLIMAKGDEVNALLVGALRFCNEEQRIALRDALIERTPKTEQKQSGQSAVWVKASERLPGKRGIYFVSFVHRNDRPTEDNILKAAWLFDESGKRVIVGEKSYYEDYYVLIEWLDESPQKQLSNEEIEVLAEKEYPIEVKKFKDFEKSNQSIKYVFDVIKKGKMEAFIKGYKKALGITS